MTVGLRRWSDALNPRLEMVLQMMMQSRDIEHRERFAVRYEKVVVSLTLH